MEVKLRNNIRLINKIDLKEEILCQKKEFLKGMVQVKESELIKVVEDVRKLNLLEKGEIENKKEVNEIVKKDKKVERYIKEIEYHPYFFLKKLDDDNFDKDFDDLILVDKNIVEIFDIIGTLNGIKQQILEYLYEDTDPKLEVFLKKEYNKNIDYLNKKKELLLKLKGSE